MTMVGTSFAENCCCGASISVQEFVVEMMPQVNEWRRVHYKHTNGQEKAIGSAPIPLATVIQDIVNERLRQLDKHGDQSHLPDGTGPKTLLEALPAIPSWKYRSNLRAMDLANWAKARCKAASQNEGGNGTITYEQILTEEWAEAIAESDTTELRKELIQVAAVCVAWIEKLDQEKEKKLNG